MWNYLEWGGAQIYFLALMRTVSGKFDVRAVLPAGSDRKILDYLEANNVQNDFYEGSMESAAAATVGQRIRRRVNDFLNNVALGKQLSRYDLKNAIVQIDVAPWAGFALLFYLILKTDVFVTFHTAIPALSLWRRMLWKAKFLLLNASKHFHLVASNADVKKSLQTFVGAERYEQIEIVYSSVNVEEIEMALANSQTREEIARKYDFPPEKIWVCNVAQFIERKGCWTFLEAIEILRKRRSDLFFCWMGTAPLEKEIVRLIGEYDLGADFRFLSADEIGKTRTDLLTLWQSADIFVLPSFQEGLPVALIEAMALGRACIASNVNAIPEAVRHLENGVLVEAGDSQILAQAIADLADDKSLRERLGVNAKEFVLKNFDEKIIGDKMRRLYEKVD